MPVDASTSAIMSRIRARNTKPELALRQALRALGWTGYRLHYKRVPGRPDIAFVGKRVAVFVHGCFWHGCPKCAPSRPKSHQAFWNAKLDANKARDKRKERSLMDEGWKVVTCWECQIKANAIRQAKRVTRLLEPSS